MTEEILKNIDDLEKHLTKAKTNNSDFQRAIYNHNQHLGIAQKIDDRAGEGRAYANLGNAYRSLGKFQEAINYHNQDLNIAQEVGDRVGEGRAYGNLGNAYRSLAKFQEAINYHNQDLNICLLYTSPSPRDATLSRMPSSA